MTALDRRSEQDPPVDQIDRPAARPFSYAVRGARPHRRLPVPVWAVLLGVLGGGAALTVVELLL